MGERSLRFAGATVHVERSTHASLCAEFVLCFDAHRLDSGIVVCDFLDQLFRIMGNGSCGLGRLALVGPPRGARILSMRRRPYFPTRDRASPPSRKSRFNRFRRFRSSWGVADFRGRTYQQPAWLERDGMGGARDTSCAWFSATSAETRSFRGTSRRSARQGDAVASTTETTKAAGSATSRWGRAFSGGRPREPARGRAERTWSRDEHARRVERRAR